MLVTKSTPTKPPIHGRSNAIYGYVRTVLSQWGGHGGGGWGVEGGRPARVKPELLIPANLKYASELFQPSPWKQLEFF